MSDTHDDAAACCNGVADTDDNGNTITDNNGVTDNNIIAHDNSVTYDNGVASDNSIAQHAAKSCIDHAARGRRESSVRRQDAGVRHSLV
jgi:hypothetical protein